MKSHSPKFYLCLVFLLGVHCFGDAAGESVEPEKSHFVLETAVPPELRDLHLENPMVVFIVETDSIGDIRQSMAIDSTDYRLLNKAEQKLEESEFNHERAAGSKSRQFFVTVRFFDPLQRAWKSGLANIPMGSSASDATERRLYESSKRSFVYKESSPAELDQPLQLLESRLNLVHETDKPMQKGRVLVEYYVDYKGAVRFPKIIESDHDSLTVSAFKTLEETRFAPPRINGNPTYVRVRQPFNFD